SLDGGVRWQYRSELFTAGVPQHKECGSNAEQFNALDGNYPQPEPDGSLVVMVACGGKTYLARSTDEAGSWPIIRNGDGQPRVIPNAAELRTDPYGNLYELQQDGKSLLLRTSRDDGVTWSNSLDMTAPGVVNIDQWYVAVRGAGQIAVSYYGQRAGQPEVDRGVAGRLLWP